MALMIIDAIEIDSAGTLKEIADYMRYVPMDLYLDGFCIDLMGHLQILIG